MKKLTNNWVTKILFIVSTCTIVYALLVSGMCDGPIHAILPGTYDGSLCDNYSNLVGCFFTLPLEQASFLSPFRVTIVAFIGGLFIIVAIVIYLTFALPKLFRLRMVNENEA